MNPLLFVMKQEMCVGDAHRLSNPVVLKSLSAAEAALDEASKLQAKLEECLALRRAALAIAFEKAKEAQRRIKK